MSEEFPHSGRASVRTGAKKSIDVGGYDGEDRFIPLSHPSCDSVLLLRFVRGQNADYFSLLRICLLSRLSS